MDPDQPSVAVIICTNSDARRAELRASIESVLSQEQRPAETIVVVDHNPALQEWIAGQGFPILVVANSSQRGLSGARRS
jgi:glycosyltransferase involved in cell wall biosynthesis